MRLASKRFNHTDNELLLRYIDTGNKEYIGELYIRYSHLVYLVCQKYFENAEDSKDAVTDIFEKLLLSIQNYEIDNFKNWIYSVTKNHCLMKIRSQKSIFISDNSINLDQIVFENEDETIEEREKEHYIRHTISKLNHEQKKCVNMFYFKNQSYKEIATELGLEIRHVKSHIQNGKRNLKRILLQNKRVYAL
jgi:RNA polymerase sigma-70 factor (ECF subfamily)